MLKGDVRLGAGVRDRHCGGHSAGRFTERRSPQHLHHDGLLGVSKSFHCLSMGGLGESFPVDLQRQEDTAHHGGKKTEAVVTDA